MGYNRTTLLSKEIANIPNIQILQNEISLGRWIFDALILIYSIGESCNLKKHLEIKSEGITFMPDMYLEKGCRALNISGKTIIEIKNNLLISTEIRQTRIFKQLIDNKVVDNIFILYIHASNTTINDHYNRENIHYIRAEYFINRIKSAIDKGKGYINQQIIDKKKTKTWKTSRNDIMAKAKYDFRHFNSVFFLGAGVSASANTPDWEKLLRELLPTESIINEKDFKKIFKQLDYSNLITARYIQKLIGIDDAELSNRIKDILYSNNSSGQSDLISAICHCVKNQQMVQSIITYNYDTFIEDQLQLIGKKCFSIYKNNHDESQSFPIYHVHGVLFRDYSQQDNPIVLSEKKYHDVYSKIYDWSNVEQLHALTRCTCYFIGLSMKDPNLRRLLDIAKQESGSSVRHYVFLERRSECKGKEKRDKDFHTREDLLADLGVNVIWYKANENHKELPLLLKELSS